jgi:DNA-binding transcriptional regulator YdaS (Cro superfamily)
MKLRVLVCVAMVMATAGIAGHVSAKEPQQTEQECSRRAQAAAEQLRGIARAIEAEVDYAETHGGAFSPELTQEFVRWYQAESSKAGTGLPDLGRSDVSSDEGRRRQAAVDRFVNERAARRKAEMDAIHKRAAMGCPPAVPLRSAN